MKADRARASAASVFDALGSDFWSWWRWTVGGALLVLPAALALQALNLSGLERATLSLIMLTSTLVLGFGIAVVTYLVSQRASGWQRVLSERRLPSHLYKSGTGPLGWVLTGTFLWVAVPIATVELSLAGGPNPWGSVVPWLVALLVMTAAGAAIGRWDRGWVSRLGALVVFLLYVSSSGFVADAVRAMGTGQFLGIGVAALLLLVWSFRRPTELQGRPTPMGWLNWRGLAHHEPVLRAWYRERLEGGMRLLVVMFFLPPLLIGPFMPNQALKGHVVGLFLAAQVLVLLLAVVAWHVPEQHCRYRLLPSFARQRYGLALKLWWAQFRWVAPFSLVFALLSAPSNALWADGADAREAYGNTIQAFPWLMANLALLTAGATLWVGLRRAARRWDWLLGLVALAAPPAWVWVDPMGKGLLNLSGRLDLLAGTLAITLLLLAVATWVWQRGSLAGMERWSAAGQRPLA